ncbi:MAG TPA: redoxin domain-containing protein [Fimbriiglobus sp.]|nr:redoxin domain-containing protein [Fimbriiglobus sp.]
MRITTRTLAGLTLLAGLASNQAVAQVKTEDVLARKPVQPSVSITTPTGADLAGCKAEPVTWPKQGNNPAPTGVVVKDAQGRLVRQFIDTTGSKDPAKANIWSYYLNGVESYREVDGNGNGKPDQYRWLGANGGKWGIDINEDGQVDTWHMISPEELSQELFEAILTKNAKKVEALLPSDQDLKSIGLPDSEIAKVRQKSAGAVKRMTETAEALQLTDKARWVHLELEVPQVTPADAFGGRDDVVKHRSASVLVDKGDGKSAVVFQTGELMLIGRSWKLVEGPTAGAAPPPVAAEAGAPGEVTIPQGAADVLAEINKLPQPTNPAEMAKYQLRRAALLEKIVGMTQGAQQEPWLKQVIDAYTSAAESGEAAAMARLKEWHDQIDKTAPKSAAAAYAAFRLAAAEHAARLAKADKQEEMLKVQSWWRDQLEAFVAKYPAGEDAPEAMNRLAVAFEYVKDGEAKAKEWYERLAKDHPSHPYGVKAKGAVKRLTCEGQPFVLTGRTLDGGKDFSVAQLAGKAVIVYYWASWGRDAVNELKALGELVKTYGPKGLELVTISLDDDPAKAVQALNAAQVPGTHLHLPGGLDRSPLAAAYGIQMVPHVFLVGKDGKVVDNNAQTGPTFKDAVEKLVK